VTGADVAHAIEAFVRDEFAVSPSDDTFDRTVDLFDDGYVDSVGVIELLEFIRASFSVEIPEEDLFSPDFSTIDGIAAIVTRARTRG
jgi:acyl carrier protein